jgi:hypothetical protein
MNESFAPEDEIDSLAYGHAEVDYRVTHRAPVASGSVDLLTEGDYKSLMDRSSLGTGLANITSRLLHQLANGGDPIPYAGTGRPRSSQRDTRGNRVPWDDSPLVAWQRIVAVSDAGSMLALVSMPIPTRSSGGRA